MDAQTADRRMMKMKEIAGVTIRIDGAVMTACVDGEIDHHSARGVRVDIDEAFAQSRRASCSICRG